MPTVEFPHTKIEAVTRGRKQGFPGITMKLANEAQIC